MPRCNPNFFRALWPAFLTAIPGAALLFSAVDPRDMELFGTDVVLSRPAMYSLGFVLLWLLCWAASAINLWLFGCRRDSDADAQ